MFVITEPAAMEATAAGLQAIGSATTAGNAAAAEPTTAVIPPASDPTSALMALMFGTHGGVYQAAAAVAAAVHEMTVANLGINAGSYAVTEALNVVAAM